MADYGELGYLLAQRRAAMPNRGAEELGAVLGGGGARYNAIFNNAASQGALMQDRLAQARQRQYDEIEKQRQRDSRHKLADSMRDSNPLGAQFLDSYENPEQAAKAQHDLLASQFMQEAWAARNGDPNALNRMLMVMHGQPVEFQRSLGDGSYTPNAYDTTSAPQLSEIGRAFVGEKRALAGEHQAQAERARAGIGADKAANYEVKETDDGSMILVDKLHPGNAQPVTSGGTPVKGKQAPGKSFTEAEYAALVPDPNNPGKPDPVNLGRLLMQPGRNDIERLQNLRSDDAVAQDMGPPSSLATPPPSLLSRLFGGSSGTAGATPSQGAAAAPGQTAMPQVGEVRKGYRYKGGDPSNQTSWEKVS